MLRQIELEDADKKVSSGMTTPTNSDANTSMKKKGVVSRVRNFVSRVLGRHG